MRRRLAGLSALLLLAARATWAAPNPSELPTPESLAHSLESAFGPYGLELLKSKGYLILQGRPGGYRLKEAHWKALAELSRVSQAALSLAEAYRALKEGRPPSLEEEPGYLTLSELPPSGLMTQPLRTAMTVVAAAHDDQKALAVSTEAASEALPAQALLFETPWGQRFAARTRADLAIDPKDLVGPYVESALGGVRPEPDAIGHFLSHIRSRYKTDVSKILIDDLRKGTLSEPLRAWLRRYLIDQRRLTSIKRNADRIERLEKASRLSQDLAELENVARFLKDKPDYLPALQALAAKVSTAAAGGPLLSPAGLHLQQPGALGRHEMGDTLTLSGAYWVDGLPEGRSALIEETTFLEYPEGYSDFQTALVKRANGGPYAFVRKAALKDSRAFAFRAVVSAPESNTISERLPVAVSRDFELALSSLARADHQALVCEFKEAEGSQVRLGQSIETAAALKPQYRDLLKASARRRAEAESKAQELAKILELIAQSKADASPENCRYDPARTRAATKRLQALPAGCGRYLPELSRQLETIERRASDQEAFAKAAALARSRWESCDFAAAADSAAQGLAILDADPPARCGATDESAKKLEADLAPIRSGEAWRSEFAARLRDAEAQTSPEARLKVLTSVVARIGSLASSSCYSKERDQAERLADQEGLSLRPPEAKTALQLLGADERLEKVEAEVSAERHKLAESSAAVQEKRAQEQAPASPAEASSQQPSAVSPPQAARAAPTEGPAKPPEAKPAETSKAKPKIKPKAEVKKAEVKKEVRPTAKKSDGKPSKKTAKKKAKKKASKKKPAKKSKKKPS